MPTCSHCSQAFIVTKEDRAFLQKLSPTIGGKIYELPEPTHCPECRQQRRIAQGNQLHLYRRTCDFTGAPIISNYHPDSPYMVYRQDIWWSDKWDPLSYGRDIDWKRSFFEQYRDLLLVVPRYSLHTSYEFSENADYTNYATKNKDCYLIFDSDENRDCYYSYSVNSSENCVDCYRGGKCRHCFECIDCVQCYACSFTQDCQNCADSLFLKNCIGCKHCIMCSNLQNKEYWIENRKSTKEEYEKIAGMLTSHTSLAGASERFRELCLQYPQRFMHGMQNEDSIGDYLTNCKNAYQCFDSRDLWDCRYNYQGWMPTKDAMDVQEIGDTELAYECAFSGMEAQRLWFTSHCFGSHDLLYCSFCPNAGPLFGCVGMKRKKYCILNKQYTEEEYETLAEKLIAMMRKTKEWGEFFPVSTASFAYNESLAQDYFPLSEEECKKEGFGWRADDPKERVAPTFTVPETIAGIPDTVTGKILACDTCGKNYRIIQKELEFLREKRFPLPRSCFFCRHKRRMGERNPRTLWRRKCGKCNAPITTTYAPGRPEKVYCEGCYLATVY
jgi:hypothetical protein